MNATPSTSTTPAESRVAERVRAEYREMPGLRLTQQQAARLWGLDIQQSVQVLSELTSTGFLIRDSRGAYRRTGCPRCA